MILCSVMVSAIDREGLVGYWNMDFDENDKVSDNNPIASGCNNIETNGALGNSTRCNLNKITYDMSKVNIEPRGNYTQIIWVNYTTQPVNTGIGGIWSTGKAGVFGGGDFNGSNIYNEKDTVNTIATFYGDGVGDTTAGNFNTINMATWYMIAVTYDGATIIQSSSEAGVLQIDGNASVSTILLDNTGIFYIGGRADGDVAQLKNVNFDEISLWNRTLTHDELKEIYNGGIPLPLSDYTGGGGTTGDVTVGLESPPDNHHNNSQSINFTFSVNSTNSSLHSCALVIDNAVVAINSTPENNSFNRFIDIPVAEGWHNWTVNCEDVNANMGNTTNRTLTIDTTDPIIIGDAIRFNNTFWYDYIDGQINASDTNLFSIFFELNSTDIIANVTDVNDTLYQYNFSANIMNYTAGVHNATFKACDGHTTSSLTDNWLYDTGIFGLEYSDNEGRWYRINPENWDLFEDIDTIRQYDRYDFRYKKSWLGNLLTKNSEYVFVVESSEYIYTQPSPNSQYNAWLIIPNVGKDGRWIDFNLEGTEKAKYKVERINSNKVKVTITEVPQEMKELIFKSTGELNCITQHYEWYKYNYTQTYITPYITEASSQDYTLNITRNDTYIQTANATLMWNGTSYNVSPSIYTDYFWFQKNIIVPQVTANTDIFFNWSYTLNGYETKDNETQNISQRIIDFSMDNCTTYTIPTLNFTLVKEYDNKTINGTMKMTFGLASNGLQLNYSAELTNYQMAFCISNHNVTFTTDMQAEYYAPDYNIHTYYMWNKTISNQTDYIMLYLQNGTTSVLFYVRDEYDDPVRNAFIKVLKQDLGTGTFDTVSILETDTLGQAIGQIQLDTAWYQFIVEYEGEVVLIDGPTIMTSTTRYLRIKLGDDYMDRFSNVLDIEYTFGFDDDNNDFILTYSDPSGEIVEACVSVTNQSVLENIVINQTCISSTAGTIYSGFNSSVNESCFLGTAYITDSEGSVHVLGNILKCFEDTYEKWGAEGVIFAFFIILTLIMAGLFHPAAAVVLGVISLVFVNLMHLYHLNWVLLFGYILLGIFVAMRAGRDK